MPYHVGEKGSYGCDGYPAVKDDGTVMGCHDTKEQAANQIYAINQSEGNIEAGVGIKNPEEWPIDKSDCCPEDPITKEAPCWDGYVQRGMKEKNGRMVPNCVPVEKAIKEEMYRKFKVKRRKPGYVSDSTGAIVAGSDSMTTKASLTEGNFVMAVTADGVIHGVIEHIMWEGGTLGIEGSEYALVSMPPENPAMSIRIYEYDEDEEYGYWEPTPYSIGAMYQDARLVQVEESDFEDPEMMEKAEGYAPTSGMKAAARRALKWKEEGKATGAGTPVGWGRATDIVAGRSMSLSVVKRMYSFFSRHEVDKKGKDFNNMSNPSNGRIMWDAWGGDAGFAWSKAIVKREMDKALFANFGKDYTNVDQLTHIFKD